MSQQAHVSTFSLQAAIDCNHTANMVKKELDQTACSLIATNNDAIAYLKMGELNESYSLLSEAIAALQQLIREPPPPKSTTFRYKFRWTDLRHSIANYVLKSSEQQTGLLFLFQKCLIVDMPRKREIRVNKLCPFGISWILHYNLALVAHLLGIQKAEYGKSYLQEAKRLYGIVSTLVQSRGYSADYAVLIMGIWNNQGCIYLELGMEEHATNCLDRLRILLKCTRPSRDRLRTWRFFYLNLVTLEKQRSVAAAA